MEVCAVSLFEMGKSLFIHKGSIIDSLVVIMSLIPFSFSVNFDFLAESMSHPLTLRMRIDKILTIPIPYRFLLIDSIPYRFSYRFLF